MFRSSSAVVRGPGGMSGGGLPPGVRTPAGGSGGDPTPSASSIRPLATSSDSADRRAAACPRHSERFRSAAGRIANAGRAAAEELRRSRGRRSTLGERSRGPEVSNGAPSASRTGGSAARSRSARQSVRDASRGRCAMNGLPSSRQPRSGDARLTGTARDVTRSRNHYERNCAQWFARLEERSEEPTGRPSHSEVRQLRKELEALRRLVTGEQLP